MASGGNLQALENEIKDCLAKQLYSEALDLYEDLEASGQMMTSHWIGKGDCLLRLRRKQDAKAAWLRAFELDPANAVLHDLLDQNFPGWTPPAPKLAPRPVQPPPPPPAPVEPPPAPRYSAASVTTPTGSSPNIPRAVAPASTPGIPRAAALAMEARAAAATQSAAPTPPPVSAEPPAGTGRVNWKFIMEDYGDAIRANPTLKPPQLASQAAS